MTRLERRGSCVASESSSQSCSSLVAVDDAVADAVEVTVADAVELAASDAPLVAESVEVPLTTAATVLPERLEIAGPGKTYEPTRSYTCNGNQRL